MEVGEKKSQWRTYKLNHKNMCYQSFILIADQSFQILFSQNVYAEYTKIVLRPVWTVINETSRDLSFLQLCDSKTRAHLWSKVVLGKRQTNIWPTSTSENNIFAMKEANSDKEAVPFRLHPPRTSAVLRIDIQAGLRVQMEERYAEGKVLTISEVDFAHIPFLLENRCNGIVLKVTQAGQKQSWLLNPGLIVPYTWDSWDQSRPRLQWTIYGSKEEPAFINFSVGETVSGETRVVQRVVKRYSRTSVAVSSSDTDFSDEDSETNLKNVVLKCRKSIFWLTKNDKITKQTHVYFFTSRKALNKLKSQLAWSPCFQMNFMAYNCHLVQRRKGDFQGLS